MKKHVTPNCFACAIGMLMFLSSMFGVPCIRLICAHSDYGRCKVIYMKVTFVLAAVLCIFLVVTATYCVNCFAMALKEELNLVSTTVLLAHSLYCVKYFIILVCTCRYASLGKLAFDAMISLAATWEHLKAETILDRNMVRTLKTRSLIYIALVIIHLTSSQLFSLFLKRVPTLLELIRRLTLSMCFSVDLTLLLAHVTVANLQKMMILRHRKRLIRILSPKYSLQRRYGKELGQYRRLHSALIWNSLGWNIFYNPALFYWITFSMIISVSGGFVSLIMIFEWAKGAVKYYPQEFVELQIQISISFVLCLASIYHIDVVVLVGQDTSSLLFKYPISTLSQEEASQVEMLIQTLELQKPLFVASDVFVVGVKLLASLTGTIVTYILVAWQFYASWS